jgi:hypothetical protein
VKTFKQRYSIDVREHIESKGGQDYLPWSHAVKYASLADEAFTFEVHEKDGVPYFPLPTSGGFVKVTATIGGKGLTSILPVLDHRNKVIPKPNPFEINKAVMRCLCKAIALHGIGLSLWSREFTEPDEREYQEEGPGNHAIVDPPEGWSWDQVTVYCQKRKWPIPSNLSVERLKKLKEHFKDLQEVHFDDLDEVSGTP